jgi:large subunit ribosomal protein L21
MYAIVTIGGQQMKVEPESFVYVNRLHEEEGSNLTLDEVLLVDNDGELTLGTPTVSGAKVKATVLEHLKDDKKVVFKKKRRKGYRVRRGHRQALTKLQIESIEA